MSLGEKIKKQKKKLVGEMRVRGRVGWGTRWRMVHMGDARGLCGWRDDHWGRGGLEHSMGEGGMLLWAHEGERVSMTRGEAGMPVCLGRGGRLQPSMPRLLFHVNPTPFPCVIFFPLFLCTLFFSLLFLFPLSQSKFSIFFLII